MNDMLQTGTTKYELVGEDSLVATRTFRAPKALMFDVFTKKEHVTKWLTGPEGWTMPVCEIDLRPGGQWKYVYRNEAKNQEFAMHGEYREIDPPNRIVQTEMMGDDPTVSVETLTFDDDNGFTRMTMTLAYPNAAVRKRVMDTGMTRGMDTSFDRLDDVLQNIGG